MAEDRERIRAMIDELLIAFNEEFPPLEPPDGGGDGDVREVLPGESLQRAVLESTPGTTIILTPGAQYDAVAQWPITGQITIRPKEEMPSGRFDPSDAPFPLPHVGRMEMFGGVRNIVLVGLEIFCPKDTTGISIGRDTATSVDDIPDGVYLDRCHIFADPAQTGWRGVAANGRSMRIEGCHIAGFRLPGRDSQAVAIWNGVGPLVIYDSYLEASGENFMAGGSDSKIPGQGPSDITIRACTLRKPPEWRSAKCGVKNLLELKNCRGAVIEDNMLDGCWADGQDGSGILFTVRNQGGTRPDSVIKDVIFRRNRVINVDATAMNLLGWDDEKTTNEQCSGLEVRDNVFESGSGGILVNRGWNGLTIVHNHFVSPTLARLLSFSAPKQSNGSVAEKYQVKKLLYSQNIVRAGRYGVNGDGTTLGEPTLKVYAPGYTFVENGIEQAPEKITWPLGNIVIPSGTLYQNGINDDLSVKAGGPFDIDTSDGLPLGATTVDPPS